MLLPSLQHVLHDLLQKSIRLVSPEDGKGLIAAGLVRDIAALQNLDRLSKRGCARSDSSLGHDGQSCKLG